MANQMRVIVGYERVMIYRIDLIGNGDSLVDDHGEGPESFLGLHFPASDIPKQPRALYLINRVR